MLDDAASATEFLSVTDLLKATPKEEGGSRFVYIEASRQTRDPQGEIVLAKALAAASDQFARYGNLDIDHMSIPSVAARHGIAQPQLWEIGRPVEVREAVFVKGEIYRGDGPLADKANEFWASQTQLSPPKRWYPSVGGQVLDRTQGVDPLTKAATTYIRAVSWTNIGFSATPVNQHVPTVSTVPFGALAKSWGAQGFDLSKALEAGYGTDVSMLEGGAALRRQSLDGAKPSERADRFQSYFDFRERVAGDLRKGLCGQSRAAIAEHAVRHLGLGIADASDWAGRFVSDLTDELRKAPRKTPNV